MMDLREIIISEINKRQAISFRDFMDMCLYYPGLGYYTSGKRRIGSNGDYYTSPCLGQLFGGTLAKQIVEMWEQMGRGPFSIVECGAGSGLLCHDILQTLQQRPEMFRSLSYHLVDKNSQQHPPAQFAEKIFFHDSLEQLGDFEGCVLSNELIDNFAVHQVVMNDQLEEVMVTHRDGSLYECTRPAPVALSEYFDNLGVRLSHGYRTEVNLAAGAWLKQISGKLKRGFILTMDYGFLSHQLYSEKRQNGNIVCYYKHGVNYHPYQHIGEQDITAHINFSALHFYGKQLNLSTLGFTSQGRFLSALGIGHSTKADAVYAPSANVLKTLLLDLGSKIKVMVQQKNLNSCALRGFMFAEPFY